MVLLGPVTNLRLLDESENPLSKGRLTFRTVLVPKLDGRKWVFWCGQIAVSLILIPRNFNLATRMRVGLVPI